jgi:TetR/AcrR family transcriptional regulator, transcriptional repressor for nem operon
MVCMTDTREHILQTAFSLFITKSYKAVTMKDLENATGLTKGAFYHYFRSKEEIFIEVIDKFYLAYHNPKSKNSLDNVSLKEYIEMHLNNMAYCMNRVKDIANVDNPDPNSISLIIEAKDYYPGFTEKLKELDSHIFNNWTQVISRAKVTGEILHDIEADILAENFIAVEYSVGRYIRCGRSLEFMFSMIKLQYNQLYRLVKK